MSESLKALGKLKVLSEIIRDLQIRSEERLKAQHRRFNLFTTLLSAGDEVRLHTRFLHELLNPAGTHDCGDLFLKLFFETLENRQPVDDDDEGVDVGWDDYAKAGYRVGKEVRKAQGQLDILLEANSHVLVIENKIWAEEADRQVARYAEYVESQNPKAGLVLFLTLDGKQADTHGDHHYLRISYREHIMDWLERCLRATYHIIPVNQALIQYRNVVKEITGQSTGTETMETIKDFIRKNPIILEHYTEISTAVTEIKKERMQAMKQRFADGLAESLADAYEVTLRPRMIESSFAIDPNPGLVIRAKENDFTGGHPFSVWVEHNKWGALCIGIEAKWKQSRELTEEEQELLEVMKAKVIVTCGEENLHLALLDKTWWGTYWPMGVHDLIKPFLDESNVAKMSGEPHLEVELVKAADAGIRSYMQVLETAYAEAKAVAAN